MQTVVGSPCCVSRHDGMGMNAAIKTGDGMCVPVKARGGICVADKTAGGGMGYMSLSGLVGHGDCSSRSMVGSKRRFCLCSSACKSVFRVLSVGWLLRLKVGDFTTTPPCTIRVKLVLLAESEGLF